MAKDNPADLARGQPDKSADFGPALAGFDQRQDPVVAVGVLAAGGAGFLPPEAAHSSLDGGHAPANLLGDGLQPHAGEVELADAVPLEFGQVGCPCRSRHICFRPQRSDVGGCELKVACPRVFRAPRTGCACSCVPCSVCSVRT